MRIFLTLTLLLCARLAFAAGTGLENTLADLASPVHSGNPAVRSTALPARLVVLTDSQGVYEQTTTGWPWHVTTNQLWRHRATVIGSGVAGSTIESVLADRTNRLDRFFTGVTNQVYVAIMLRPASPTSIPDIAAAKSNYTFLVRHCHTNNAGVFIMGGALAANTSPAWETYLSTNTIGLAYIPATNWATGDGLHPNAAGAALIATQFIARATNYIRNMPQAGSFAGLEVYPAQQFSEAMRVYGRVVLDHETDGFTGGLSDGIWWRVSNDTIYQTGIASFTNTYASQFQEQNLGIYTRDYLRAYFDSVSGYFHSMAGEIVHDTVDTNKILFIGPGGDGVFYIKGNGVDGSLPTCPIHLNAGNNTFLRIAGYPDEGVLINTTVPLNGFALNVNGSGAVSNQFRVYSDVLNYLQFYHAGTGTNGEWGISPQKDTGGTNNSLVILNDGSRMMHFAPFGNGVGIMGNATNGKALTVWGDAEVRGNISSTGNITTSGLVLSNAPFASASTVLLDAAAFTSFTLTNLLAHNSTLIVSNMLAGDQITVSGHGAVAGGTDYSLLMTNSDGTATRWALACPTNGATSFLVTNGHSWEVSFRKTKLNTSNIITAVYSLFK
jgi:hypothetical protein